jgi:hypothetical protein
VYDDHSGSRAPCASTPGWRKARPFALRAAGPRSGDAVGQFPPLTAAEVIIALVGAELASRTAHGRDREDHPLMAADVAAAVDRVPNHVFWAVGLTKRLTTTESEAVMARWGRGKGPDWGVRWAVLCIVLHKPAAGSWAPLLRHHRIHRGR